MRRYWLRRGTAAAGRRRPRRARSRRSRSSAGPRRGMVGSRWSRLSATVRLARSGFGIGPQQLTLERTVTGPPVQRRLNPAGCCSPWSGPGRPLGRWRWPASCRNARARTRSTRRSRGRTGALRPVTARPSSADGDRRARDGGAGPPHDGSRQRLRVAAERLDLVLRSSDVRPRLSIEGLVALGEELGIAMAARMPMITITTSSSISVSPRRGSLRVALVQPRPCLRARWRSEARTVPARRPSTVRDQESQGVVGGDAGALGNTAAALETFQTAPDLEVTEAQYFERSVGVVSVGALVVATA